MSTHVILLFQNPSMTSYLRVKAKVFIGNHKPFIGQIPLSSLASPPVFFPPPRSVGFSYGHWPPWTSWKFWTRSCLRVFTFALSSAWSALPSAHGLFLHFLKVSVKWSPYEKGPFSLDPVLLIYTSSLIYWSNRMHHPLTHYIFYLSV